MIAPANNGSEAIEKLPKGKNDVPTNAARSFRLSGITSSQLDDLAAFWGESITAALGRAIDREWGRTICAPPTPVAPPATVQLWQHRSAGEQYIVSVQAGQVVGAVGPIYYADRDAQLLAAHTADWEWDAELADDIDSKASDYRVMWPYVSG